MGRKRVVCFCFNLELVREQAPLQDNVSPYYQKSGYTLTCTLRVYGGALVQNQLLPPAVS